MKTPIISFSYSGIYNSLWKRWLENSGKLNIYKITLSDKTVIRLKNYKENIEKIWRKDEKKIMMELSKITGLKWRIEYINCYLVEKCFSISCPLTLSINKTFLDFIDILIHELIHTILHIHENYDLTREAWNYINKKYKKETKTTRLHIPVLAIHTHIFLKFSNEQRLNRHIRMSNYARAWQIVQKEGYQNIIREFRRRIK